jgi:molybdopterin molybdotransferase
VQGKAAREGIAAGKTASEAPVRGVAKLARRATPFFGLPGNPVSTMVTFHLFARPVIDALSGARPQPLAFAQAKLKNDLTSKIGLTRFLPAKLSGGEEQPEVELLHWHGSGDLMAVSRSNCYIVVPPDRDTFNAGENITVLMT